MISFLRAALRLLTAVLTAFVLTAIVIRVAGGNPIAAFRALMSGAFGSRYDVGSTLAKMIPLLLTGLGVAVAFRAKLWNIGGEGQFLVGAIAASALGAYTLKSLPATVLLPLILVGGTLAGALWGGLAGWMRVARGVPEVISTIMLNFIAAQLLSYLVHGPMQEHTRAIPGSSETLSNNAALSLILAGTPLHTGFLIALAAVIVVAAYLYLTPAGFAVRAVGANPEAARIAGIPVERTQISVMVWSGALCGLAGAVELSGVVGTLYENYAPGYGFTAVAVALLGRLNPFGIIASALFFGALSAGSISMQSRAGVSSVLIYVVQAIALLTLLGFQWRRPARAALPEV